MTEREHSIGIICVIAYKTRQSLTSEISARQQNAVPRERWPLQRY